MNKIVITGMGAVTPIGIGVAEYWNGLVSGMHGIGKITRFDASALPVQIAAEVKGFDATEHMPRKLAREMDLFMQYGYVAAEEAMQDADLHPDVPEARTVPAERIGIVVGTAFAGIATIAETQNSISTGAQSKVSPRFVPKVIGNIAAAQIAIAKGLRGPSLTDTTSCTSGAEA